MGKFRISWGLSRYDEGERYFNKEEDIERALVESVWMDFEGDPAEDRITCFLEDLEHLDGDDEDQTTLSYTVEKTEYVEMKVDMVKVRELLQEKWNAYRAEIDARRQQEKEREFERLKRELGRE